jgi:SM-20-related protein
MDEGSDDTAVQSDGPLHRAFSSCYHRRTFDLDSSLNVDELKGAFAVRGRILVLRVLEPDSALVLSELLAAESNWGLSLAAGFIGRRFMHTGRSQSALQLREIFEAAYSDCGRSFSHLYETISLATYGNPGARAAAWYAKFLEFINSETFLGFVRTVSGLSDIRSATAVACRYSSGHFYASHVDRNGGKGHRASFVFNLTQFWEPQWGGVLQFKGIKGDVAEAYLPRFNSLSLFVASQPHAVSLVSPYAPHPRLSIGGALVA